MVAITLEGVLLPEANAVPARALGANELIALEDVARRGPRAALAEAAPFGEGTDLHGLVDELQARALLPADPGGSAGLLQEPDPTPLDEMLRDDDYLVLTTPVLLRLGRAGFEHFDERGAVRIRLNAVELLAASEFRTVATPRIACDRHRQAMGAGSLDTASFLSLSRRLLGAGLLQHFESNDASQRVLSRDDRDIRHALNRERALRDVIGRQLGAHDDAERERAARTGVRRPTVIPVHFQWQIPPLALGMIVAFAKAHEGLDDFYDFRPDWLTDVDPTRQPAPGPAIYLFSHYVWSSAQNLETSARVKAANRNCLTIHGGPNVPKYDADLEEFFRVHPHVDIAVVGEGEITTAEALAALRQTVGDRPPDLSVLERIPGLAIRCGGRIVRTADRDRIVDVDALPSPYLTGLFDGFLGESVDAAVLETNRGCPYGCTFCDWGSATATRIRKFSLDRVFAELELCARNRVASIGLADANFGIFERDIAIAEKVAELRRRHGYPRHFGLNYAKNSLKHLKPIVEILGGAGVLTYGQLSLQSMDETTLRTIDRSNIKPQRYHELAHEFRRAGLPLFVDLMMGLPGATVGAFRNDLQQSIDREVIAKIHRTQLLVNSPMNEPAYRQTHGIEARPGEFVTSAASFTGDDYDQMQRMRRVFLLLEKFGVLRHVARYVRRETGMLEMEFFEQLSRDAQTARDDWPLAAFTLDAVPNLMVPPGSWHLLLDEIRHYLVEVHRVPDDDALATVITVQRMLLPARGRRFPETVALPHDYGAWHRMVMEAKDAGHLTDWPAVVPPLRTLPAGNFTVSDPHDVCVFGIGHTVDTDIYGAWELASPVSRPVSPLHAAFN